MSDKPAATSNVFVVYPENRELVSGKISFTKRSQQLRQDAIILFALMPIVGAAVWLYSSASSMSALLMTSICLVILLVIGIRKLDDAQLQLQLESGQFLEGRVVSSEVYPGRKVGQKKGLFLGVTYRFQTPEGKSLLQTVEVARHDLLYQAEKRNLWVYDEKHEWRLKEYTPPPNTPVKVRYVNDNLFRVM